MRHSRRSLTVVLLIGLGMALQAAGARGEPAWMTDEQIRALLVGPRLDGVYPAGATWTETMKADGTTVLVEGQHSMSGRWTLSGGVLCFAYVRRASGCFRYLMLGENCYEHFFLPGVSQGPAPAERPFVTNGRLWRPDQPKVCEHVGA